MEFTDWEIKTTFNGNSNTNQAYISIAVKGIYYINVYKLHEGVLLFPNTIWNPRNKLSKTVLDITVEVIFVDKYDDVVIISNLMPHYQLWNYYWMENMPWTIQISGFVDLVTFFTLPRLLT